MFDQEERPQGGGTCWDGTVTHASWGALTADGAGLVAASARPVGDVLVEGVQDASRTLALAGVTARSAPMCAERELSAALEGLDTLAGRVARVMVTVLVEAHRRGLHLDTGLSLPDWVAVRCPGLTRAQVGDLAVVVKAWDTPGHGCLRDAVTGGQVSVARGARLLRALTRVAPVTDTATYGQVVELLVPVAVHGSDKDLRAATDHLVAVALSEKDSEAKARACHDSRGIHESSLAGGSLSRFIVTADAEGAATIRGILASPLAGPAPDAQGADVRTPTQRRYDAVMSVLGRGMGSPEGAPTTAKAKIFLTIPFTALALSLAGALPGTTSTNGCRTSNAFGAAGGSAFGPACGHHDDTDHHDGPDGSGPSSGLGNGLLGGLADGSLQDGGSGGSLGGLRHGLGGGDTGGVRWPAPGLGRTFTGEGLTPGQVRRLACQADLIPVVLGTGSEVLDLGRESRLASPAQLKALWLRDQQCTFPGCTVPAQWCDAHHLTWWSRNGPTDTTNLALLCGRHHTLVHDKDLTATIDATGVTWHL